MGHGNCKLLPFGAVDVRPPGSACTCGTVVNWSPLASHVLALPLSSFGIFDESASNCPDCSTFSVVCLSLEV